MGKSIGKRIETMKNQRRGMKIEGGWHTVPSIGRPEIRYLESAEGIKAHHRKKVNETGPMIQRLDQDPLYQNPVGLKKEKKRRGPNKDAIDTSRLQLGLVNIITGQRNSGTGKRLERTYNLSRLKEKGEEKGGSNRGTT